LKMRDLPLDEIAILSREPRELHGRSKMRIGYPLPMSLSARITRGLPKAVSARLECQAEQRQGSTSVLGDQLVNSIDMNFIARKYLLQERDLDVACPA